VESAPDNFSQPVAHQPVRSSGSTPAAGLSGGVKVREIPVTGGKKSWKILVPAAVLVVGGLIAAGVYFRPRAAAPLTEKDTVVLADFDNSTGDPVFDGTLRQGLSAQLEQSPFLNLLSDQRTGQTLALMRQPKNARVTHDVAREVCPRTASAAVLDGSIAQVGARHLLTLRALDRSNGEALATTEAEARDKDHVLDALGKIASTTRSKLGESLCIGAKI